MLRKQLANLLPVLSRNKNIIKYFKSYKQSQIIEHKHLFLKSRFTIFNTFQEQQENQYKNEASKMFKMIEQEQNELNQLHHAMDLSNLLYDVIKQETEKEQKTDSICLRDYIEDLVENSETLNKSNMYMIKFYLFQANFQMNLHEQNQKYIDLFTSDQFIENDFVTLSNEYQNYLAMNLPVYLSFLKKDEEAIKLSEKFLNYIRQENQISSFNLQKIQVFLISLYRDLNQHTKAFKLVENIAYLIEQEMYLQDINKIADPKQDLVYLMFYCYDFQQYEYAYKLLHKVIQIMDENEIKLFPNLSYGVNLLKNLDKHNKTLLQINTQIKNQSEQEIEQSIQESFIESLEKFLDYQDQFNQTKEIKTKSQHIKTLIDNNFYKFSSDSKGKILKILHKYDYNTN